MHILIHMLAYMDIIIKGYREYMALQFFLSLFRQLNALLTLNKSLLTQMI